MPTLHSSQTIAALALLALLTGCAGPAKAPGPEPIAAPAPMAPAPPPEPEPAPPAPGPVLPATPAAQAQAQKIARAVIDLLEAGREDEARADLNRALVLDPANRLALNLVRQLTVDPVTALGRESFNYVVKPSDTLSRIAGRFMGDIYAFYLLARYNDIKVPRQISGGQTLRIPGKMPAGGTAEAREPVARAAPAAPAAPRAAEARVAAMTPTPAPPPAPPPPPPVAVAPVVPPPPAEPSAGERALRNGEAAERGGQLEQAMAEYKRAAALDQPSATARAEAVRKRLVERHSLAARTAFARQDLTGAVRAWDRVLELEPGHELARLERQKAQQLQQRADALK